MGHGYLYAFRVMEMFRGHGIGTWLLQEAENIIVDRGLEWSTIAVAKENHSARRLYERLGYQKFAEDSGRWSYLDHKGIVRHVHEPCWLLEKHLQSR
jgi:ribosomal protein S18 acetylase RimI-like enzyme